MATILVPLAQGCEELEAVTIIDLRRRAGLTVVVAGLEAGTVTASRGVMLLPETHIQQMLEYYMGKNTPARQDFIIENLKVELDLLEEEKTPA